MLHDARKLDNVPTGRESAGEKREKVCRGRIRKLISHFCFL